MTDIRKSKRGDANFGFGGGFEGLGRNSPGGGQHRPSGNQAGFSASRRVMVQVS